MIIKVYKYQKILEVNIVGDINYLKYLIVSKGLKVEDIARMLGMTKQCLYRKMNGKHEWYLRDIKKLKEFLEMSDEEVKKVFDI